MSPTEHVKPAVSEANSSEPVLATNNLTKRFGDRTAVYDLSLRAAKGEVFGFLIPTQRRGQDDNGSACSARSLLPHRALAQWRAWP